ncbi:MAG: cache domain-containing protein [Pricia sp.]
MLKKLLYGVAAVLLLVLLYNAYELYSFTQKRNKTVQEKGSQTMATLIGQMDTVLSQIAREGERLAKDLSTQDYTAEEIENIIKQSALKIPALQGVTACFQPYAFSEEQEFYCPYYNKGTKKFTNIGDSYDYTTEGAESTAWYTDVRDQGAQWIEPYYASGGQDWYIDYGIPIYYADGPKKGQVKGTIAMSLLTSGFKKLVHSLSIGKTGYGIVVSSKGTFLSHPINDYIGTVNLRTTMGSEQNNALLEAYEGLMKGETGKVEYEREIGSGNEIFYYDKIATSDWGIGLLFSKDELLGSRAAFNHRYIRLALLISAFLLIIIAIYFNKDYLDRQEIWQLSGLATLLLISNNIFIGYLEHTGNRRINADESLPIADMTSLSNFITQQHTRLDELKLKKSIPIPTGVFVRRLAFQDSYNLDMGGTVWQKYPLEIAD